MSNTLKSAVPVALISAVLVALFFVGYSFWFKQRVLSEFTQSQRTDIVDLRSAYQEEMEKFADRILARVDETNKTLDSAIASRSTGLIVAGKETPPVEAANVNALADAIMNRLNHVIPTAAEQDRGYDTVSTRVSERLNPILSDIARTGNLTRSDVEFYSSQITGLIDGVLKDELAEKQSLNNSLLQTTTIAQDSLRLSQEMSALYLSSLKDQGLVSRILSLPVRVVQDVSTLSIIGSSDRKKAEERLFTSLEQLEQRLNAVRADLPQNQPAPRRFEVTESTDYENQPPAARFETDSGSQNQATAFPATAGVDSGPAFPVAGGRPSDVQQIRVIAPPAKEFRESPVRARPTTPQEAAAADPTP